MIRKLCLLLVIFGCSEERPQSTLSEAMDWLNDPRGVPGADGPLTTLVGSLPSSGSSNHHVWTGSWLPYSQGGSLTATRKYDQATGAQAAAWEQAEVNRFQHISWGGHCNGLAAASTMETEPLRSVYYNGVWFDTSDIKALLTEAWNGGGTIVGGRCNNSYPARDGDGRISDSACRDMNPATLHIVITNFLGIWHKPVILDTEGGYAVWNYPAVSYRIVNSQAISRQTANGWLRGVYEDYYPYNPSAISMQYIQMEITLATGSTLNYYYILELDGKGTIIGGEWYGSSKDNQPDFIWRHTVPTTSNPYLNINVIYDIYSRSK